jgi:hypothetical protein
MKAGELRHTSTHSWPRQWIRWDLGFTPWPLCPHGIIGVTDTYGHDFDWETQEWRENVTVSLLTFWLRDRNEEKMLLRRYLHFDWDTQEWRENVTASLLTFWLRDTGMKRKCYCVVTYILTERHRNEEKMLLCRYLHFLRHFWRRLILLPFFQMQKTWVVE